MSETTPPTTTTNSGIPARVTSSRSLPAAVARRHYMTITSSRRCSTSTRERVPERVLHTKGNGAHGFFEVTEDGT
jgi:catalase